MTCYDDYAKTFSNSRKEMKWKEISSLMQNIPTSGLLSVLDVWCWSWRLIPYLKERNPGINYLWTDLSEWMISEAKRNFPDEKFLVLDMSDLSKLDSKYDFIFLIASYHHLNSPDIRLDVLKILHEKLVVWWKLLMTNWNLLSEENLSKYSWMRIIDNDFNIKIWSFHRYYHAFTLEELEILSLKADFKIKSNYFSDDNRNILTVLEK